MLLIVKTKNAPSEVKGYLRRFLTEPSSGLFIGKTSAKVAETIWESLQLDIDIKGFTAIWILGNSKTEQGYEIRQTGEDETLLDFDGFTLPVKRTKKNP